MQQHGGPVMWMGSTGQNSTFSEHGHSTYQFTGNHEMQQHGSKYFARRHLGDGVNRSNSTFSEYGHVAYQIKENHKYSNMVANISPADSLGMGL